ncbi:unnamed protein product [Caenorhabditis brenneri]
MIWRWMLSVCGMPLTSICRMVKIMNGEKMERCGTAIRDISGLIEEKAGTKYTFYFCGFRRPTIYRCYILVKLYTLAMVIGQFVVLAFMFDHNKGWTWGWEAALHFVDYGRKSTFDIDSFFPSQVFCNFTFKEMSGSYPRKETIELLLPFNRIHRKIFVILWSWLMLLIVIQLVDFVVIVMRYIMWSKKVKPLLMVSRVERDSDDDGRGRLMVEYYAKHVITPSHCLVYRFMGHCCGVGAQEVAKYMYIKWKMLSIPFMSSIIGWFSTDVPEDPVMKLVTRITAAILLFCGTITGGTLYFGDSFECMLPLTHSPEWGDFAESSCFWTPELFYVPSGEPFSAMEGANRRSHIIGYYPYTSMCALLQWSMV